LPALSSWPAYRPTRSPPHKNARIWIYQYLLATSSTERELAPITEHIVHERPLQNPQLLDFAAEVLLARIGDGGYPLQNKLRLIRVLGKEKSPRYTAVLTRVLEQSKNKMVAKEVHAAMSRKEQAGPGYVAGTIDIHAIAAELDAAALAAHPTTAQGEHLAKFSGETIDELFEWQGKPHQIVSGQTRVSDGILIHVKIQRLTFFYRGLGRVVFGYEKDFNEWTFQAVVADPMAFEEEFAYRDRAVMLGLPDDPTLEMMQLVSGYTASMRIAVEKNYRRETAPLEFMDTAGEILATQFKSAQDPVTVDMYAWSCRLLTRHGGQRYAAILQRVAAETGDSKLKRFAQLPTEPASALPAEPYIAGTISLAAQRAKYPPLYPDSTFQSGRL
jgi:hypothetical protein